MNPSARPGAGVQDPATGTPPRPPGSVRRTCVVDILRPDGPDGDVHLRGSLRDLVTTDTGAAVIACEARLEVDVAYWEERRIRRIEADPPTDGLDALVGLSAAAGFRRPARSLLPDDDHLASALGQLLDDVPVAVVISGFEIRRFDREQFGASRPIRIRPWVADACAGYVTGGTAAIDRELTGGSIVPVGPPAPDLVPGDDALSWHDVGPLGPGDMRRRRRTDVWHSDGRLVVDAMFRDAHMGTDGVETVVHEYELAAVVDVTTGVVTAARAGDRVLPYRECSAAAASADRIVGLDLAAVADHVRSTFSGASTCTHLNDALRSLADVDVLARAGGLRQTATTNDTAVENEPPTLNVTARRAPSTW